MELTPEDKTRIEKQAGWFEDTHPYDALHEAYYEGAEYATIYEREQQAELRNKAEEYRRLLLRAEMYVLPTDQTNGLITDIRNSLKK